MDIQFEVIPSTLDEKKVIEIHPKKRVLKLAYEKAKQVASQYTDAIVIGADTLVEYGGEILEKPLTREIAIKMLSKLNGKKNTVYTGTCIIDHKNQYEKNFYTKGEVYFGKMTAEEIEKYVDTGEPLDKAGGYAVQGIGSRYIKSIKGSFDSIVGLPVYEIYHELLLLETMKPIY